MHIQLFVSYLFTMLAITNPFGNLAIFIGLTSNKTVQQQRKIAISTAFATLIVLVVTTWVGGPLFKLFGISVPVFQLAGGLVITLLGLNMLQSKKSGMSHTQEENDDAAESDSIAVVPMTIPIIAGPGAMTTILVSAQNYPGVAAKVYLSIGNAIIAAIILLFLYFASNISKVLGVSGIKIATRIMGLILIALAMGMITSGLATLFPGLTHV